jgi:cytochrome P450
LLLNAHNEDTDHRLTRQEVIEQCGTFLGAGHETTGTGTTWFWHLMSKHHDARSRMIEEVDTVLEGRAPTFEDLDKLVWTRACFSEAMRIHPPVYLSMRTVAQDDVMNGYLMKKGSIVIILTHLIHRDPNVWPDPERFDPERFMPGAGADRPRGAYLPFGGGRRICIGSQFAMMEATIIAAMVTQRFTLDPLPGWRVREEGTTTLRPKGGLPMVVRHRDLHKETAASA